jgi:hypothetical protein
MKDRKGEKQANLSLRAHCPRMRVSRGSDE